MEVYTQSNATRVVSSLLLSVFAVYAQDVTSSLELRILTVSTRAEASEIRDRIEHGTSFYQLAAEHSIDPLAEDGGYMGEVHIQDLRPAFQNALVGLVPGEPSAIVEVDGQQVLLQILTEAEESWREEDRQAREAFDQGRFDNAETAFARALEIAESFGPAGYRLAQTLNNLGAVYYASGEFRRAEEFFERAVESTEEAVGPEHPDVANSLENLADVQLLNGHAADAQAALERALTIREASDGPNSSGVALTLNSLGLTLESQERYAEAADSFRRALSILEDVAGPDAPQTASTLAALGTALALDGTNLGEAERALRRAHAVLEATYGPASPDALDALGTLGDILERRGDYGEALSIREKWIDLKWGGPDAQGDPLPLLDGLAELLSLNAFRDSEFDHVLESLVAGAASSSLGGNLYLFMGDILTEADMGSESVMLLDAIRPQFSGSRVMEYEFAEALAAAGRTEDALIRFQETGRMPSLVALSSEEDAVELSRIYRRAGDMAVDISELAVAADAYDRAISLDEDNIPAYLGRASLHLLMGEGADAEGQYAAALEHDPNNVEARLGRAEALLQTGNFSAAAEAADRVLADDPDHARALYIRGTALARAGETETGRSDLTRYRQMEDAASIADESEREILLIKDEAGDAFLKGASDEVLAILRNGIAQHPGALPLHLSLAIALRKLGRDQEAIEALERAIALGLNDDFVLHYQLSEAYREAGDPDQSRLHRSLYLDRLIDQIEARFD